MSSGGTSNYSSGATGGGTGVTPEPSAPYAQSAPAPSGGKGGYNPNPYSQQQPQQPQVYMPPSQPTFYDQAFMQPQVRSYGLGGMGGGNAYARPFRSYGSPIERAPPVDEMRYVSGPDLAPAVMPDTPPMARPAVMPATYPTRRNPFADGGQMSDMRREYPVGATPSMPGLMPDEYPTRRRPEIPYQGPPIEATRGVTPEPNYSGGLGSLFGGTSGSVPYPSSPSPSGFGPLQQQNPQLLAQMEMAKAAEAQRAAQLQQMKQNPSSSYSWNNGLWNA